jgi:hypothetical protein
MQQQWLLAVGLIVQAGGEAVSQQERFCSMGWLQQHGTAVPVSTSTASDVIAATMYRTAFITVIFASVPVAGKCGSYKAPDAARKTRRLVEEAAYRTSLRTARQISL